MPKRTISTEDAPAAIGPYSQATIAGGFLFISGQIPIDPKTGLLTKQSPAEQMRLVMNNIGAILKQAGVSFKDVVKCGIFVTDLGEFKAINAVYAEFFDDQPPARATIEVSALPLGVDVEVDVIAYAGE
ncbi:RidA family protein [bacterium]|nr:RidA family protein [bacterium]